MLEYQGVSEKSQVKYKPRQLSAASLWPALESTAAHVLNGTRAASAIQPESHVAQQ